jgi:DivIVA domain-containing protein
MTVFVILFAVIAVVGVALVFMFAADKLPGIEDPTHDEAPREDLQFPVSAAALAGVQFSVRFRGYDMEEVDVLIDNLVDQLAVAEARANGDYITTAVPPAPTVDETASAVVEPEPGVIDTSPVIAGTAEQA